MENETISVIVPIYKVEKYIRKCIESIISQEYKNLEIILVDDESPDKCGEICEEYAKKDNRIKVIHKKNGGLSDARNVGINYANGEYIGFVDSDDYIESDMYKVLYKNIKKYEADISICKYREVLEDKQYKSCEVKQEQIEIYSNLEEKWRQLLLGNKITDHAMNKLYKKDLFDDIKFRESYKFEDIDIMYKLFEKSKRIVFTTYIGYNYLQREGSIVKTMNDRSTLDLMEVVNDRYNYIKDKRILENLNKARRIRFIYRYHVIFAKNNSKEYYSNKLLEEYNFFRTNYKTTRAEFNIRLYERILIRLLFVNRNLFYTIIKNIFKLRGI